MSTLGELKSNIKLSLQNESDISDDIIRARINEGILYCSRHVTLSDLEDIGTFDTELDTNEVDIPLIWNYQRKLYGAGVPEAKPIVIASSIGLLRLLHPLVDVEVINGDIEHMCIRKGRLVYFPIPTEITTVQCKFYTKPIPLVKDKEVPDCLPEALHNGLLESFALWKIFATIEDGVEGVKVNTKYYKNEFFETLNSIDEYVDEGQSQVDPIRESGWI